MKRFPTLFKKTSTGAIQYWKISADLLEKERECIITKYGQKGTKKEQITIDQIKSGKNKGRSNATTKMEQAYAEAKSKWEKQKKKGYVENLDDAELGKTDALIKGGILPMLAHNYKDHSHKIQFPCYAQPKLDGHRCTSIIKGNKCTLWTRTRKQYFSVPHISKELEKIGVDIILDGELYSHKFKNDFEFISHIVRQQKPHKDHEKIQYHIYDIISEDSFESRHRKLKEISKLFLGTNIVLVETHKIKVSMEIESMFKHFINQGYEGMMLRNSKGTYEHKRSYNLQKVKKMQDSEYKIVGIKEGRGKLSGHVEVLYVKQMEYNSKQRCQGI